MAEAASLRDQLATAMQDAPEIEAPATAPPEAAAEPAAAVPAVTETAEQKRARDEAGRFAKTAGAVEKAAAPPPVAVADPLAPAPRKPPSSWAKEYHEQYQKLDPALQEYLDKREGQYASGVSTYRQEAEQAREFHAAVAPFAPDLQAAGITAGQWVQNVAQAHHMLVKGTPQQKLAMFQRLAGDYKIPAQLAVQDAQGQWQLLGQAQPQQPQFNPADVTRLVRQELEGERNQQTLQQFLADAPTKYPHYEAVKDTMVGLLQSGLAQDLPGAYDKALRMNDDLWQAEQLRRTTDAETQRRATQQAKVAQARAQAVSPRSATPAANMAAGKKDRRSLLEEAVEAADGRV